MSVAVEGSLLAFLLACSRVVSCEIATPVRVFCAQVVQPQLITIGQLHTIVVYYLHCCDINCILKFGVFRSGSFGFTCKGNHMGERLFLVNRRCRTPATTARWCISVSWLSLLGVQNARWFIFFHVDDFAPGLRQGEVSRLGCVLASLVMD